MSGLEGDQSPRSGSLGSSIVETLGSQSQLGIVVEFHRLQLILQPN